MQGLWNLIGKVGQGTGKDFPYEIGEAIHGIEGHSVWALHKGKNKNTGEAVCIFVCDGKTSPPDELHVAKSGYKRLRTLRHPNVLKFIDGYETDALVYMVTEAVQPLSIALNAEECTSHNLTSWGIHQVASTVSFLVNDSNLVHGNINIFSVFVDQGGEWKVGGVEYIHSDGSDPIARLASLSKYDPPEGFAKNQHLPKWSKDAWGVGCLLWEIFNGPLKRSSDLKSLSKLPKLLVPHYCELVSANPKSRVNPKQFLDDASKPGQYLCNDFIRANLFLQEIQIKDIKEQKEFFQSINNSLDNFPKHFCVHKVLPQLLNAFEFGAAGSTVLSPLFKVGKLLENDEYQKKIVPCVIKLFSSNDRATRIQLLQQMDNFISHLQPGVVNDQIFPNIATGFGDTLPAMREQTIKSTVFLAPKLSEKTMNNHLLRYFAKLQMDEQPGIRTNTTICLGKIASYIPKGTRAKVLVPAFLRAVRDPFPPGRSAAILAMAATQEFYSVQDLANRLLPALCPLLTDPEKSVRANAFKVAKSFTSKLEAMSNDPESCLNKKDADLTKTEDGGSTWTGWAVSSLASRFYTQGSNENQTGVPPQSDKDNQPAATVARSKPEKLVVPHPVTQGSDKDQSGSDYQSDGGWSDENWEDVREDVTIDSMKQDLMNAKKDLLHTKSKGKQLANKSDESDHSDYGDWENDDWGQSTTFASPDVEGLSLQGDILKSHGVSTTKSNKLVNPNTKLAAKGPKTDLTDTASNWDDVSNAWDDSWGNGDTLAPKEEITVSASNTSKTVTSKDNADKQAAKEARKAELLKIREERRQAKKEGGAKQKKAGAMKLGGVKRVKDNID